MPTALKRELTEKTEAAIFKNYRAALNTRASDLIEMRAPARRQNALKLTADRYQVPISVVKNIVRRNNETAGTKQSN